MFAKIRLWKTVHDLVVIPPCLYRRSLGLVLGFRQSLAVTVELSVHQTVHISCTYLSKKYLFTVKNGQNKYLFFVAYSRYYCPIESRIKRDGRTGTLKVYGLVPLDSGNSGSKSVKLTFNAVNIPWPCGGLGDLRQEFLEITRSKDIEGTWPFRAKPQ